MQKPLFFLVLVTLSIASCETKFRQTDGSAKKDSTTLRYAQGFSIVKTAGYTVVEVKRPFQNASSGFKYLLLRHDQTAPPEFKDIPIIKIPVEKIVCTSTTHIPMLDYLGVSDRLVGFPTTDYISSEMTRKLVDEGKVQELGVDKGMDLEKLAFIKPQMVLGYTMTGDFGQFKKIEQLKIPVVLNAEYLETHPLGRAEWIKFVAAFFDREQRADSVFNAIEQAYNSSAKLVSDVRQRPTVLSGIMYGDGWFLPGGQNYASTILRDAGCKYMWEDDRSSGFLQLNFEAVLDIAKDADLWIGVGPISSLKDLGNIDQKYKLFKAFQTGHVYNYDRKKGAKGGNTYLELGYLRPDLILKDLIKISHPELMRDHELYFYRKLE